MKFSGKCAKNSAFTLLEVLVASAILVMIVFSIYSCWTAILRASKAGLTAADEAQRSRVAIRAVEDALITGQMYSENLAYYYFLADTQDENYAYLSLVSRLPDENFPGINRYPDQLLRRITFEVRPGEDNKNELVMTQFPALATTNEMFQPYSMTLVRDLNFFNLQFWDQQRGEWVSEFTATNQLPKAVKVYIGWGHMKDNPSQPLGFFSRTIALPGTGVMGDVQRPQ